MNSYELEIPGILTWKFKTLDEAVNRTIPLMVRSIPFVRISRMEADGRQSDVLRLDADGGTCPFCHGAETVIRISGDAERYDALKVCRNCSRSFKDYPSRICGPDACNRGAGRR